MSSKIKTYTIGLCFLLASLMIVPAASNLYASNTTNAVPATALVAWGGHGGGHGGWGGGHGYWGGGHGYWGGGHNYWGGGHGYWGGYRGYTPYYYNSYYNYPYYYNSYYPYYYYY